MINKNNLDIFVCAYKEFNKPVTNEVYKTLSVGNNNELYGDDTIRDDTGDSISNMNGFFSELTGMYWVWKNYNVKDYVGFCHYRRYFKFLDNIPNVINDYDIILPTPLQFNGTLREVYSVCHNIEDLECIKNILCNKFNVQEHIVNDVFNKQKYMFCNNIFIMKKELFFEYCEFVFGVLFEYLKMNKLETIEDVKKMVKNNSHKYLKKFYPNNTIEYQSRLGGFFAERIFNVWLKIKSNLNIQTYELITSENKYNKINEKDFL